MNRNPKIPEGYRQDSQGNLVLEANIREVDLLRDMLVLEVAEEALAKRQELAEFRGSVYDRVDAFVQDSASRFKVKMGGTKGNLTLFTFDGQYKLQVATADTIAFDERLQVAKALIDKCIQKWSDGANANLVALVNDAFQVDRSGNVSAGRVLGLRRHAIDDRDWKKAMDAIAESVQVVGSKRYVRLYQRDEAGGYQPISLDVASA
jgi:hypothetical protein